MIKVEAVLLHLSAAAAVALVGGEDPGGDGAAALGLSHVVQDLADGPRRLHVAQGHRRQVRLVGL